ncbi:MAG: hypothetical protein ACRENA_17005 [Vulcanimicrobiaceae bacterium]
MGVRRPWLGVFALVLCAGCGGGTVAGNSNTPSMVSFENGSGRFVGYFQLAPASATPILITAVGTQSNYAIVQADASYTWSIAYVGAATTFPNAVPNPANGLTGPLSCPAQPANAGAFPAAAALVVESPASATSAGGYITYGGTPASTVGVLPTGATAPYCLLVTAIAGNGQIGTTEVLVSN